MLIEGGMEVNISDLTWDQFIYPRGGKSEKTINAYVEALAIGAQFPPIKIQRVFNYADGNETTEATIILDGIHRWFAFKEKGIKEIAAVEWKDKPLDYEKNKTALLLESAECNISHGDRLSASDKKRIARDIASTDPECKWTESALAEKLGVIRQTVNAWISDIRARQKASRNTVILRLNHLGWTQEKISETVGLSQNRVSEIIGNANFGNIDNLLSQGHEMDYIARHYNMDLPLARPPRLSGQSISA
jgi:DNA-binding XRE family transcriptional regulator